MDFMLTKNIEIDLLNDGIQLESHDLHSCDRRIFADGFLYSRNWGVFYVSIGMHQYLKWLLNRLEFAQRRGFNTMKALEASFRLNKQPIPESVLEVSCLDLEQAADLYIQQPGVAFGSSASYKRDILYVAKRENLNRKELEFFSEDLGFRIQELFDD